MPSKLKPVPSPQIEKMDEKIIETIETLMIQYLNDSSKMLMKDKKTAIKKIVRLSSGLH